MALLSCVMPGDCFVVAGGTSVMPGDASMMPGSAQQDETIPSFATLCAKAILSSSKEQLYLQDIYGWIVTHYPKFDSSDNKWKISVRNILSKHPGFQKGNRYQAKGHSWSIHPACNQDFLLGNVDDRKHARKRIAAYKDGGVEMSSKHKHSARVEPYPMKKQQQQLQEIDGKVRQANTNHIENCGDDQYLPSQYAPAHHFQEGFASIPTQSVQQYPALCQAIQGNQSTVLYDTPSSMHQYPAYSKQIVQQHESQGPPKEIHCPSQMPDLPLLLPVSSVVSTSSDSNTRNEQDNENDSMDLAATLCQAILGDQSTVLYDTPSSMHQYPAYSKQIVQQHESQGPPKEIHCPSQILDLPLSTSSDSNTRNEQDNGNDSMNLPSFQHIPTALSAKQDVGSCGEMTETTKDLNDVLEENGHWRKVENHWTELMKKS